MRQHTRELMHNTHVKCTQAQPRLCHTGIKQTKKDQQAYRSCRFPPLTQRFCFRYQFTQRLHTWASRSTITSQPFGIKSHKQKHNKPNQAGIEPQRESVCVCMCVCECCRQAAVDNEINNRQAHAQRHGHARTAVWCLPALATRCVCARSEPCSVWTPAANERSCSHSRCGDVLRSDT